MIYRILADAIVLLHFAFVLFVLFGGLLVLRWKGVALVHLPAALWGALIEFADWWCPLTTLENALRRRSGAAGYEEGFIQHYIFALLYPDGLTRSMQIAIGILVIVVNVVVYGVVALRKP